MNMAKRIRKKSKSIKVSRKINKKAKPVLNFPRRSIKPTGLSIAAFFFSLLGFIFSWMIGIGWALSLISIIFASASFKSGRSRGLSIISLIIGIIGLLLWLIFLMFPSSM
jgi:hypothetical protein